MIHRIANIVGILILVALIAVPVMATDTPPATVFSQGSYQNDVQIVVSTESAGSVTQNSATLRGYLSSLGPYTTVQVWFELSNGQSTGRQTMSAPGQFSARVSGLAPGTEYNFHAVAISTLMGGQHAQGNNLTFTTQHSIPQAPIEIQTLSASPVTSASATIHGYLSSMGPYNTVTVWFNWGNSSGVPSSTGHQVLYGPGPFSIQLSGLSPRTTYYFRASAKPDVIGVSTVYGSTNTFITSGGSALSVATGAESGVTTNSATITGYLNSMGSYRSAYIWFEWGATPSYGQTTKMQTIYSPGQFEYTLQGLNAGSTYHFRAMAVPATAGSVTATGADSFFTTTYAPPLQVSTTSASNIAASSATLNGVLNSTGASGNVYVWFEYGPDRTFGNSTPQQTLNYPGNFNALVNGLVPGRTYYYRAASFSNGTNVYGQTSAFRMGSSSPVSISTSAASSISTNTATFNGYISSLGTLNSVQVWFNWGTSPDYGKITEYQTVTGQQAVSAQVTGLSSGTVYYFQAVAQAPDGGKTYGAQQMFTTVGNSNIAVSTAPVTNITGSTAVLNGTLENMGNTPQVQLWFEYGTTADFGNSTEPQVTSNPGAFSTTITGLAPGRTYYYRAVALNPTAGGRSVHSPASSFTTSGSGPGPTPEPSTVPMFVWLIGGAFIVVILILIILLASRS